MNNHSDSFYNIPSIYNIPLVHSDSIYHHINAYEHNHIKINDISINASPIYGLSNRKFVATQYPKESARELFWNMIYQLKSPIIVNFISENEYHDKENMDIIPRHHTKYWDYKNNNIHVKSKLLSHESYADIFEILVNDHKCILLWNKTWKDNSIQDISCINSLISYSESHINDNNISNDHPIVVHCSAGVGRTGTFIACYIIQEYLSNNKHVNIPDILTNLRIRRPYMVANINQYQMIIDYYYEQHYNL